VIDQGTVKELFYHVFFENVTSGETKLNNDHQAQINSLGNLKYLLEQIKVNWIPLLTQEKRNIRNQEMCQSSRPFCSE
jgi:hypothetical protein